MSKLNKIKETCIYVSDLEATKYFYHHILELSIISIKLGRHIFFKVGDDVLLCFIPETTKNEGTLPPHFAYGQQHFAFECPKDKYEYWKDRLTKNSITIEHEATWKNGLKSIYFRDPDNHSVEIVMPGIWGF